jgi:RNA polymerase sigma-32 factor
MALVKATQTERSDRRYIAATMDMPLLERDHEVDLAKRWLKKRDEKALHELVGAHARLVVRIAAGFRASGLPLADLIQEGNIGLMEAAERFDPEREVRFSTYASWWIVASIQNHILRNSSIVRAATTPKQRRLFFNLRRLRGRVGAGFDGGLSTDERIALAKRLGVTVTEVERMETHLARPDQSLNTAIGNDESAEIQDFLADPSPNPEEIAEHENGRQARSDWIQQALDQLTPRERKIVERRFLDDDQKETLADIGDSFGVSKERIRQIEARALQKMKEALTKLADRPEDLVES